MENKDLFENIVQGQKDYLGIMNATKESIKNELVLVDWAKLLYDELGPYLDENATNEEINMLINNKIKEVIK